MDKEITQKPTGKELLILGILWEIGPATVRQVNELMNKEQKTGYTTTLKFMQIMTKKGLLIRDDSKFQHIFAPAISEDITQGQVVDDMIDKVFGGSAQKLVMQALSRKRVSPDQMTQIRQLLDEMEGE